MMQQAQHVFNEQICSSINISDRFIKQLSSKFQACKKLRAAKRAWQSFLDSVLSKRYIDEKWSFYKVMLTLDLLSIIDVLYVHTDLLFDFIDRFYQKSGDNMSDSSKEITEFLIQQRYHNFQVFLLLKLLIGLHLDIKQESITNLSIYTQTKRQQNKKSIAVMVLDSDVVYNKYQSIKKIMKKIHTFIMIEGLRDEDFNVEINTKQNTFLQSYYYSSKQFKQSFEHLKCLLQYEQLANAKFQFETLGVKINTQIKLNQSQLKRSEALIQMILKSIPDPFFSLFKIDLKNRQIPFEKLDLLKFKALQFLFHKYQFVPSDKNALKIIQDLLNLQIFVREKSVKIFQEIRSLVKLSIELKTKGSQIQSQKNISFQSFINSEVQRSPYQLLLSIFYKIDVQISGLICSRWKNQQEQQKIKQQDAILVIGKTYVGKSSFINFLANKQIAPTAKNRNSTTFEPSIYKISKQVKTINNQIEQSKIYSISLCDLPGLMDTRSKIHKLCVCFFLTYYIKSFRSIKFVYLDQLNVFDSNNFAQCVKIFGDVFELQPNHLKSLFTIFSKSPKINSSSIKEEQKIQLTQQFQKNVQELFKYKSKSRDQIKTFTNSLKSIMCSQYGWFTQKNQRQNNRQKVNFVSQNQQTGELTQQQKKLALTLRTTANQRNRINIISSLSKIQPVTKLSFDPIVFLETQESMKIKQLQNQISVQILYHLTNSDTQFDKFIQFYSIIQTFKEANKQTKQMIEEVYQARKNVLEDEYKSIFILYSHFKKVTNANQKDNNIKIQQIMRKHITNYYYKSWRQSLQKDLKSELGNQKWLYDRLIKQIPEQLQQFEKNVQENRRSQVPTTSLNLSQEIKNKIANQQLLPKINDCFQQYKRIIQQQTHRQSLFGEYLELICMASGQKVQKKISQRIINLEIQIIRTQKLLKNDNFKQLFKQSRHALKLKSLLQNKSITHIQKVFLSFVSIYVNNKRLITQELVHLVTYYLELTLRQWHEKKADLDYKVSKLLKQQNKPQKINEYGECFCEDEIKLSNVLKINFRRANNKYSLLCYKQIKIYCDVIDFDIQDITIQCESLTIVANEIKGLQKIYDNSIKIVGLDNSKCTVLVLSRKSKDIESLKSKIDFQTKSESSNEHERTSKNLQKCFQNLNKKENSEIKQNLKTKQKPLMPQEIKNKMLISRTRVSEGEYLEKFQITPHFKYIIKLEEEQNFEKKRIFLRRHFTMQNLLQFGQLHLKKLYMLHKKHSIDQIRQYYEQKTQFERELIEYVINKFTNTSSLELKYELCGTDFCNKIIPKIEEYHHKNDDKPRRKTIFFESRIHRSFNEQIDDDKNPLFTECTVLMKDQLFQKLYKYITDATLEESEYGRNYINQLGKQQINAISQYCQAFLSMPLLSFKKKYQQQKVLLKHTKQFILDYQSGILFAKQQQLSFLQKIKATIEIVFSSLINKQNINLKSVNFIPEKIKNQFQKIKYLQTKKGFAEYRVSLINVHSIVSQDIQELQQSALSRFSEHISLNILRKDFGKIIGQYENVKGILYKYQDQYHSIHCEIGYAYLQKLMFNQAYQQFQLLPSKVQHLNNYRILFDTLNVKYKSKQLQLARKGSSQVIQKAIYEYYKDPQNKDQIIQNPWKTEYIERSIALRQKRLTNTWNILSFDSCKYQNDVVNILFAAEIQKTTRRPIMHMFDTIVCKNSSTFIGSILSIPKKLDRIDNQYNYNQFAPLYSAESFLQNSTQIIQTFKNSSYFERKLNSINMIDLPIQLIAMKQEQQNSVVITPYNFQQVLEGKKSKMYGIIKQFVDSKGKQKNTNPLVDIYDSKYFPSLRLNSHKLTNILSLGSGIGQLQQPKPSYNKYTTKQWNRLNRWQLTFSKQVKIENLVVEEWIQYGRIFIEEKWIDNTKEMRELFDDLEDRPYKEEYKRFNKDRNVML